MQLLVAAARAFDGIASSMLSSHCHQCCCVVGGLTFTLNVRSNWNTCLVSSDIYLLALFSYGSQKCLPKKKKKKRVHLNPTVGDGLHKGLKRVQIPSVPRLNIATCNFYVFQKGFPNPAEMGSPSFDATLYFQP